MNGFTLSKLPPALTLAFALCAGLPVPGRAAEPKSEPWKPGVIISFDEIKKRWDGKLNEARAAAATGDITALHFLGRAYYDGAGVGKDYQEARHWFELAAARGFPNSEIMLAMIYENGLGIEKNEATARSWYLKAGNHGDPAAQFYVGEFFLRSKGSFQDDVQALEWYRKSAAQGYPAGEGMVGAMLADGRGTKVDREEAVKWMRRAAEKGDTRSLVNLGWHYEVGFIAAPEPMEEAIKWYRRAAEQGSARGQFNLGEYYRNPATGGPSLQEALKWYRLATDQGYADAQYELAQLYARGDGEPRDENDSAQRLYELAAAQGHIDACGRLASRYHNGYVAPQDFVKECFWNRRRFFLRMKQAASGRVTYGSQQDYEDPLSLINKEKPVAARSSDATWREIVRLFCDAMDKHDASAMRTIGQAYLAGRGVPVNPGEAYAWCHLAAGLGDKAATGICANLKSRLSPAQIATAVERSVELFPKR